MEANSKKIQITVLEDNLYYNRMLTQTIENNLMKIIPPNSDIEYHIDSFLSYQDFLFNFQPETSIAFVDFYLENQKTGLDALRLIKKNCLNCKVVVLSDSKNFWNMYFCLTQGASGIIVKDDNMDSLCGYLIEEQIKKIGL